MLSALILVGVPSAVGIAGWLCFNEGRAVGRGQGWRAAWKEIDRDGVNRKHAQKMDEAELRYRG